MSIITDMDHFLSKMSTTDTKDRLSVGARILNYLAEPTNSIACSDIGSVIDTIILWLQSSNSKVVQLALEILAELIGHMNGDFHPYLSALSPHLIDKLGDSKETIRKKTLELFGKLVEYNVTSVQNLFNRIAAPCFSHKNSYVREEAMHLLISMINSYGATSLHVSKLVPYLVKLLGDPNASVRQTAFDTFCQLYKHVGDRLRTDLQKKYSIPHNKLPALLAKFDKIKTSDCSFMDQSVNVNGDDETDKNVYQLSNMLASAYRPPITPNAQKTRKIVPAGSLTEELFDAAFEDVPTIKLYSSRDVEDNLKKCQIIGNENEDWKKRVSCLKTIRSLILVGGLQYEEFQSSLMALLPSFETALKDLRSQVVREACITVAYLSKNLGNKFDRFAEAVLENLLSLIPNSAKVMASSGLVCIRYILQHTHSSRLIPIITNGLNSKSKDIRRACCEFINIILQKWPVSTIEKHAFKVQEAIKKGIMDADPEARVYSRSAYTEFAQHFPDLAENLKNSLDLSYKKLLGSNSCTSSTSSLSKIDHRPTIRPYTAASCRSTSAIDLQAANRARIRAQYAAMDRQKMGTTPPKKPLKEPRSSRTKSRVSVSQPSSRSGSPSSRVVYNQYLDCSLRARRSSVDSNSRDSSLTRSGFKSQLPVRKPSLGHRSKETDYLLSDFEYLRLKQFKLDDIDNVDKDSTSYDSGISQMSSGGHYDFPDAARDSNALKTCIDELSHVDEQTCKEILNKMVWLVKDGPSDAIVMHFKNLLGKIIALISESHPPAVKETALLLLQTVVKRKTVTFLLKQYSDLIIIRVIAVCGDDCKEVAKAAENCAMVLSTYLPAESVIRVIVPLIPSEVTSVKLVSIKMLTRAIECSDDSVITLYLDQIMAVVLLAYDDSASSIRKAAVFCMVTLHKQSEEMKIRLEPYISKLQGAKLKLLQLYIRRAEQGSSMPTSPRCD